MAQRQTSERAKRALAVRSQSPWFDPATLGIALQVGRSIGLRRIVPLVAAGVLAAALGEGMVPRPASDERRDVEDEEAPKLRAKRRKRVRRLRERRARDAAVLVHAPHQLVDRCRISAPA